MLTPALYDLIDLTPGTAQDSPDYNLNGLDDTQRPGCPALNLADQAANDDHYSDYWRKRNLIPGAKGSDVPLFLTQGLTENNTVADGTAQYLDNHAGPERAWLGPWEHVRGNETDELRPPEDGPRGLLRRGHALLRPVPQGHAPAVAGPAGRRADQRRQVARRAGWPPADSTGYTTPLRPGTYSDDGSGSATESDADGVWTANANCSQCDPQQDPRGPGCAAMARYMHCGCYPCRTTAGCAHSGNAVLRRVPPGDPQCARAVPSGSPGRDCGGNRRRAPNPAGA